MSNNLAPLADKSDEELRQISTVVRQHLATESEEALKNVFSKIDQNSSLMTRFLPTALQTEEKRIVLQRMRSTVKAQEEMYRLYTDIQLEFTRRQGDALIASVEVNLQTKLTSFVMAKYEEVQQTFAASRRRFEQRIRPELEEMQKYKDIPDLYELAHQSIQEDQRVFYEIIDRLREGFRAAIERRIKSLRI